MVTSTRWKIAQMAERKWWQNYLQKKEVTTYLIWKKEYWQNLLSTCTAHFSIHPADTILDAGCGPAGVFMCFPDNKVTAFDPLINSYEKDLPHFNKSKYPNVQFIESGLEDFSTQSTFDVVFCMNAINHVQNIKNAYDVLCNNVAKGKYLVITIDAHNHSIFKKIFRLLPGDILHPHQFDLKEYNDFLTSRGLKILETKKLKKEFFFDHYIQIAVNSSEI